MELKFGALSPYVRKVMIVAHEAGVADRLTLTPINTREEPEKISPHNPRGKIPVLVTDDGHNLFDSPVICEYLDAEFGGHRLLPVSGPRRWDVMTRAALADGLLDAAILVRHERARVAERQMADFIAWHLRKIITGLDHLEATAQRLDEPLDLAQVGVGAALGYMPLRIKEVEGLKAWPKLAAWYARVSQRPSFQKTVPVL